MNLLFKASAILGLTVVAGLSVGIGISIAPTLQSYLASTAKQTINMDVQANEESTTDSDEPMYWVAPMDPNYRRDAPGKSPMGMDLVPVYDDGKGLPAGTVSISPEVVNNLGVKTAIATNEIVSDEIATVGIVKFDERQQSVIHSRVSGWIKRLAVRASGDRIDQYDHLYNIYSPELVSAQEELLLALSANEKGLQSASEQKLRNLGVSRGAINRLIKSRKVVNDISVYAPNGGVVDKLFIEQGAYVTPATRIMSIAGLDPIWIEGEIFENSLAKITAGAAVQVTAESHPGDNWQGVVDYIYPDLDAKSRTAKIRIIVDNPSNSLLPNMFVRLHINTSTQAPMLTVPNDAVIRTGKMNRVVLATGEGRYKSVEVTTGQRTQGRTEVLSGIREGDKIVVSAQFLIDSESSIDSDFKRMMPPEEMPDIAWTNGTVEDIYADESIVVINHQPVPEWEWPAMEMEFVYAETLNAADFERNDAVRFSMRKLQSGEILIESVEPGEGASNQ